MSELMTVAQVAAVLNCSEETVTRRFAREKGVIDLASAGSTRRRRYRVLRIPTSVVEKYALQHGGRIQVKPSESTPAKPRRRPVSMPTEDDIACDLAALAQQRGPEARKTVERIARRARLMQFVPKDRWQDMVFLDEDES
jgi:hypothetical protein